MKRSYTTHTATTVTPCSLLMREQITHTRLHSRSVETADISNDKDREEVTTLNISECIQNGGELGTDFSARELL